jgi:bifunctional UDP-N-acetylglucosamine pyrophosphorylase/glucosamine-1-phosphate N-acetyltransferase
MRAAVILAAGKGTRMGGGRPKVLHELAGKSLVEHVLETVEGLVDRTIVVVGHGHEQVRAVLSRRDDLRFALQEPQEGTGHALACALPELKGATSLVVLAGDAPLIRRASVEALFCEHDARGAAATVMGFQAADPKGYGRLLRSGDGQLAAIVEESEANEAQRRVDEVNSGTYAFDAAAVLPLLPKLPRSAKGEYYLTDVVAMLGAAGRPVAMTLVEEREALGINTPEQLQAAELILADSD